MRASRGQGGQEERGHPHPAERGGLCLHRQHPTAGLEAQPPSLSLAPRVHRRAAAVMGQAALGVEAAWPRKGNDVK